MATFKAEIQKERKDGTFNIKILMTHERKLKRIPTSLYITKQDLTRSGNIKNQSVIDQIENIIKGYRQKCNSLSLTISGMDIEDLFQFLTEKEKSEKIDFIDFFRKYILNNQDKKGIKNYSSALNSLIKFLNRETLDIMEINKRFLELFAASIKGERAVSLYLGSIKTVYNAAKLEFNDEDSGKILIPYSPFSKFSMPRQNVSEKRAIDVYLLRKIIELPYDGNIRGIDKENRFNLAKDVFIMSFALIGMNSVDLFNCQIFEDGYIKYFRTKTKDRRVDKAEIHIKVPSEINKLFHKYRDRTKKKVFRFYQMYSTEGTFNSALNKGLKELSDRLGVDKIDFYAARHSWATIARNNADIDKMTVHEALNHVDNQTKVTDIYIKKDFSAINKANKKVLKIVFGDNEKAGD